MNNIYAFGDIHGEFNKLDALIKRLYIKDNDILVFLGDYIDRGPRSFEVIEYLIKLDKKHSCIFIKGNHEEMFVDYLSGIHERMFTLNGGRNTIKNYISNGFDIDNYDYRKRKLPKGHAEFLNNLKWYHETDEFIFVHAGIAPGVPLERTPTDYFAWNRDFVLSDYYGPKTVVFGHTPSTKIMNEENQICIDTGACFESMGDLTCVKLPDRIFIRQGPVLKDEYGYK